MTIPMIETRGTVHDNATAEGDAARIKTSREEEEEDWRGMHRIVGTHPRIVRIELHRKRRDEGEENDGGGDVVVGRAGGDGTGRPTTQ